MSNKDITGWTTVDHGKHAVGVFYPADAQMKKDYPGVRHFVSYANDTKIKMFSNKDAARKFVAIVNNALVEPFDISNPRLKYQQAFKDGKIGANVTYEMFLKGLKK